MTKPNQKKKQTKTSLQKNWKNSRWIFFFFFVNMFVAFNWCEGGRFSSHWLRCKMCQYAAQKLGAMHQRKNTRTLSCGSIVVVFPSMMFSHRVPIQTSSHPPCEKLQTHCWDRAWCRAKCPVLLQKHQTFLTAPVWYARSSVDRLTHQ